MRDSLLGLIGVGVGVVVLAMLMRRYLPHTPLFSHVMLEPPSDAELEDLAHREALVDFEHLLGHQGVATTQLTPSGKARFGNELVDVIADGEVDQPRRRSGRRGRAGQSRRGPLWRPAACSQPPNYRLSSDSRTLSLASHTRSRASSWIPWFGPRCCCWLAWPW